MEVGFDLEHNLRFKDNISKYVKIKTVNSDIEHEGWLKCINPMTGQFCLVTFEDTMNVRSITPFMTDECSGMEVLKDSNERIKSVLVKMHQLDRNFDKVYPEYQEHASDRKKHVIAWIKKNRLPIVEKEDGSLIVSGNVKVKPPYCVQSCSNLINIKTRALERVQQLMSKLPCDARPDIDFSQVTNS